MPTYSEWFTDLQDLGMQYNVLNMPGGYQPMDVEATTTFVDVAHQRSTSWYQFHSFLNGEAPGTTVASFDCGYQHAMSGDDGDQWWSTDLSFYPPDNSGSSATGGICAPNNTGIVGTDFANRLVGLDCNSTADAGDYYQVAGHNFAIGFKLAPWVIQFGPSAGLPDPIPPDNATLEWEYDTVDLQALEASGDETVSTPQPDIGGVTLWRFPGSGFTAQWGGSGWEYVIGDLPNGDPIAEYSGAGAGLWQDITGYVDFGDLVDPDVAGLFDIIANANSGLNTISCSKPGSTSQNRADQWLALRLAMLPRRYRWVFDTPPVTRMWPRDTLGFAPGERVAPPTRTARVVGGHH